MGDVAVVPAKETSICLKDADMERAKKMAETINVEDTQLVLQFGVGAQNKISAFTSSYLNTIKNKDTGEIGESILSLVSTLKGVDTNDFLSANKANGFFSKLFNSVDRFVEKYNKVGVQVDSIASTLDKGRMSLLKDSEMQEQHYKLVTTLRGDLDICIIAGEIRIKQIYDEELPKRQAIAEAATDPVIIQEFNDYKNAVARLEKKIYDLKCTRMAAIQCAPQIRMIQDMENSLSEKIQSSISTITLVWKIAITNAISVARARNVNKTLSEVTDKANEVYSQAASSLHDGAVEVATEVERGILEVETFKKVNTDLIATLQDTLKIHEDAKMKRAEAEKEFIQMESDLKTALISAKA